MNVCVVAFKLAIGNDLLISSLLPHLKNKFNIYVVSEKTNLTQPDLIMNAGGSAVKMAISSLNPLNIFRFVSYVRHQKIEVIYFLTSHPLNFFTSLICRYIFGKKIVSHVHDPLPHSGSGYGFFIFIFQWLQVLITNRVLVSGKNIKKDLLKYYPINEANVDLVKFGFHRDSLKDFTPTPFANRFRFSVLGRIEDYKGIDIFIESVYLFLQKEFKKNIKFTIVGEGSFDKYYSLINKLNLNEYFDIRNYKVTNKEFDDICKESIAVVLPYRDATQTGTTQIAFSLATPVIVTNTGSLPEDVLDSDGGVVINPNDSKVIAEAMLQILNNKAMWDKYSNNAFNYAKHSLSWTTVSQGYIHSIVKTVI